MRATRVWTKLLHEVDSQESTGLSRTDAHAPRSSDGPAAGAVRWRARYWAPRLTEYVGVGLTLASASCLICAL